MQDGGCLGLAAELVTWGGYSRYKGLSPGRTLHECNVPKTTTKNEENNIWMALTMYEAFSGSTLQ